MKPSLLLGTALALFLLCWIPLILAQNATEGVCCSRDGSVETCNPEYRNITPPICAMGVQMAPSRMIQASATSSHASLGAGQIMVEGSFYYRDFFGNPKPLRYAPVYIYEYNALLSQPIAMTITDNNGNFIAGPFENRDSSLDGTTADIQVAANTLGSRISVTNDVLVIEYYLYSNVAMNVPDGMVNLGTTVPAENQNGAWAIYDAGMSGWLYPYYNFNYSAPRVNLRWPDMNWFIFTVPDGAYYVHGGDIYVGLDAATSPDVIQHEYSHFLMYKLYGDWFPEKQKCSNHTMYEKSSTNCAWTEGWATFLPLVISNDPFFTYFGKYNYDIETREIFGDYGDDVSGRVAAALYDIYDNSSDYFDNISAGIMPIWSIANSSRVQNLSQFWSIWKSRGYDYRGGLGALYQNTIDYCLDADGDGYKEEPCGWDCNDANANINPGKAEACNGVDDDCDGVADEGFDNDGDGYTTCNGDCNDTDAKQHPNQIWYKDYDSDGVSDGVIVIQCSRPSKYRLLSELSSMLIDCNDNSAAMSPLLSETCGDGIDNNCDGKVDYGCCTNECSPGSRRCNGNVVQTCNEYNADGCLEWPSSTTGPGNENLSTTGYCSGSSYYGCSADTGNCNMLSADGCEATFMNDHYNCGSCGNACKNLQICKSGRRLNFPVFIRGDTNNDCKIDIFDLATVGIFYGLNSSYAAWDVNSDINADGVTNIFDLAAVGLKFGKRCSDVNETRDERQRAYAKILDTFNQTLENFAIWPSRWELDHTDALIMSAGIKNNASDGKNHSFVVNVLPMGVDSNILRNFCVPYTNIFECKLDEQTTYAALMSTLINWSKSQIMINGSSIGFVNITVNSYAPAGTYLFGVAACRTDGTGINTAEQCTRATHNWGNFFPLEILIRPIAL